MALIRSEFWQLWYPIGQLEGLAWPWRLKFASDLQDCPALSRFASDSTQLEAQPIFWSFNESESFVHWVYSKTGNRLHLMEDKIVHGFRKFVYWSLPSTKHPEAWAASRGSPQCLDRKEFFWLHCLPCLQDLLSFQDLYPLQRSLPVWSCHRWALIFAFWNSALCSRKVVWSKINSLKRALTHFCDPMSGIRILFSVHANKLSFWVLSSEGDIRYACQTNASWALICVTELSDKGQTSKPDSRKVSEGDSKIFRRLMAHGQSPFLTWIRVSYP